MIFDALWWAERRAKKEVQKINERYGPLFEAAKKDQAEVQAIYAEYRMERDLITGPESVRTERLVKRAKKLGISIPPVPAPDDDNEFWERNRTTGDVYLTDKGECELARLIRKEEMDRLEYQMGSDTNHRSDWHYHGAYSFGSCLEVKIGNPTAPGFCSPFREATPALRSYGA